jgi:hypothetical protein
MLRAMASGRGVRLSYDECAALTLDTAATTAALGGDVGEDPPPWLTPGERRRWQTAIEQLGTVDWWEVWPSAPWDLAPSAPLEGE